MKKEFFVFVLLMVVAIVFGFLNLPPSLNNISSALTGLLGILGLYLLARQLFNWQVASVAGFLASVSLWPLIFARSSFEAMLIPTALSFIFFFTWKGLRTNHTLYFVLAGVLLGLGIYFNDFFYAGLPLKLAALVVLSLFVSYWAYLRNDFSLSKYELARNKLLKGFAIVGLLVVFSFIPSVFNIWVDQSACPNCIIKIQSIALGRSLDYVIFMEGLAKTVGMFIFVGDESTQHNIPGSPALAWPLIIFFLIGFGKEFRHWLKKKHDHVSPVHTFIFAWLFILLIPAILSPSAPDSLMALSVMPIVMILTAKGILWAFEAANRLEYSTNPEKHAMFHSHLAPHVLFVLIVFLVAIGTYEYWRYFFIWQNGLF